MMAEYIDRELLVGYLNDDIAACENQPLESESVSYGCKIGLTYAVGLAKAMPDADVVEVLHGEWLPVTTYDGREHLYRCSVCNRHEQVIYEYCHCGAKMDGKGEDNATD